MWFVSLPKIKTSLSDRITSKNIITVGSSITGLSSYSGFVSSKITAITSDLWDQHQDVFFQQITMESNTTVQEYLDYFTEPMLKTIHGWRSDLYPKRLDQTKINDFLGDIPTKQTLSLDDIPWSSHLFN